MLRLALACGDYDRTRALEEGTIRPDGIELTYLRLPVEETFFRMLRHREFEVAELSMSFYVVSLQSEPAPFVGLPVLTFRMFRNGSIYVNADAGIAEPADPRGKAVVFPSTSSAQECGSGGSWPSTTRSADACPLRHA